MPWYRSPAVCMFVCLFLCLWICPRSHYCSHMGRTFSFLSYAEGEGFLGPENFSWTKLSMMSFCDVITIKCHILASNWSEASKYFPNFLQSQHFPTYGMQSLLPEELDSAVVAQSVEWPLWGMGICGFDPGLRHTKIIKNGTTCSLLGTHDVANMW